MKRVNDQRPGQSVKVDPDSRKNDELVACVNDYTDASLVAKQDVEKDSVEAYRHMNSWIDESAYEWPVKVYDPVLHSMEQTRISKFADALFSQGPIAEFMARNESSVKQAKAMNAVMDYHIQMDRPRRTFLNGVLGCGMTGNQVYHPTWDTVERELWYWKRVPVQYTVIDPFTGQPSKFEWEDGGWKYVRTRKKIKDNCSIKTLHITQILPDTSVETIEEGEWFGFRDIISPREAEERCKTDGWDRRAVKRASEADLPTWAKSRLGDIFEWQSSIGLNVQGDKSSILGKEKRKSIEVIEMYRRKRFGIERIVVLQRAWVAWFGPSPFGHGKMPFVMAKNYSFDKQFWGVSDYKIVKWLLRAINTFLAASTAEAAIGAMPPILLKQGAEIIGKRWSPRAEWYLEGMEPQELKFFESSGVSRQISEAMRMALSERMDNALGSSEPGRGAADPRVKATVASIATQMQGLRDKQLIDNLCDDVVVPWFEQASDLIQQYQDYEVQIGLTGNENEQPVTIYPEDFRGGDYWVKPQCNTAALKELDKKRALDTRHEMMQDPNVNQWELSNWVMGRMAPELVDKLMNPQQQMQQQMQQQGVPGQANMAPGFQSPFEQGDSTAEAAADLGAAYGV